MEPKQVSLSDSKLGPQFIAILAQQLQYMLDNSRWKMNHEIAAPPNHPNLSLSLGVEDSIQRVFRGAHPTPGLGALSVNVVPSQINGRD